MRHETPHWVDIDTGIVLVSIATRVHIDLRRRGRDRRWPGKHRSAWREWVREPDSSILRSVSEWPRPPAEEENFSFSQGYTLTRDGAMYVLGNTYYHPNLVYRIDLQTGKSSLIGPHDADATRVALARSKETSIAANERYAYSVDQIDPVISRADLAAARPDLPHISQERRQGCDGPAQSRLTMRVVGFVP